MPKVVRLHHGRDTVTGFAIPANALNKPSAIDPNKTWAELGYKLGDTLEDGSPYEPDPEPEPERAAPRAAAEKK
jgi:hypothetical protein